VVGMGPGGEEVANRLAEAGLQVVGIEERLLGGECPYFACVPTKMMVRGSDLLSEARRVPGMSGDTSVTSDWSPVARRVRDDATDNWDDRVAVERFEKFGGHFVRATGRFLARDRIAAGGRTFVAERGVVIATGTSPAVPPIDGLSDVRYWTNRDAVKTEVVPRSLAVLGGGPVGLELAQVFTRFGARVTIIEASERLVANDEPESSELIEAVLRREGVEVRTGSGATRVSSDDGGVHIALSNGETVSAEQLLVAVGRRNNLPALQVEKAGLDAKARFVEVDDNMRAAPGIWAIGDITGKGAFTHVAMYQADIAVADILGQEHAPADYRALPRVTFTDPEIGSAGLTEKQARDQGLNVRTGIYDIAKTARGWIHKVGNDGFIKVVEDADRGVLVGATSVGPSGGEVLAMLTVAVHAEVPVSKLQTMITAYPTFHRGIGDALQNLKQ